MTNVNMQPDDRRWRGLQRTTAVLSVIPVTTGLLTMLGTADPIYRGTGVPDLPLLDGNLRFFGGLWFGAGLAMAWLVPRMHEQAPLFRALWLMVFLGGVGRLLSMAATGLPPLPFIAFTALELVGAPLFVVWHRRLCRSTAVGRLRA